jgi:CRP-like cAMP-binding protein
MSDHSRSIENSIIPYGELLTEDELRLVAENSNIVPYKKKEVIFRQHTRTSHIMFVRSGFVKIYKEGRNNKFIILKVGVEGDYLGLISIFGDETFQYSAAAIESAEICFVDINVFQDIVRQNGEFALKIVNVVSRDGLYIFDRLMSQSHKQLPGRIADVILYFAEGIYESEEFLFPFTRRELAELAGTTKESFIRTLTEFKNDKIIDLDGSKVNIKSMKIVKTLSELG